MMSKIIIAILIVAAAVAGYYTFNTDKAKAPEAPVATAPTGGKKMAFSQFLKQGGTYKCTVNQYLGDIGGPSTKGVTYIDSGKIRGEYLTHAQGMTIYSTFIMRDGYTYTWSSMMPNTGFKSKINATATVSSGGSAAPAGTYSFNSDQIGDYDCEAWTADPAMFAVPTSITFKEI